ncbi:uncharacterized protein PHALS_03216 [Plasmopara halstedii]|uniref:Uncharacterized protein n=1 Tax=Plasmopara halstedii TaxID=4781 RepID=A0A0P1AW25_PLAHL|nr:uncharacterized protein PHALS_03216 [Plasmopara halstedii]CEG46617.1 hypothetical protein PHALS_03216 [Plasmopara halstedii]|eukprot:XP_024582986.1 hypothetical protein PHALS_03216 [Plasmopara halstedii]
MRSRVWIPKASNTGICKCDCNGCDPFLMFIAYVHQLHIRIAVGALDLVFRLCATNMARHQPGQNVRKAMQQVTLERSINGNNIRIAFVDFW